jgi:rod shape-determining protein MreB
VTEVERRAVQEAAFDAGAREAYLIEEPMAAAIGANLAVQESKGSMVVDIGGGTTEIAVISLGGIVVNRSIRVAGDEMDGAVIAFARLKHSLLIGEQTAEEVKISIGSTFLSEDNKQTVVRGRDLESGLPKSLKLNAPEIREALANVVNQIISGIKDVIEETPPEFIGDIMEQGITLAGGGAKLKGIDKLIAQEIKMPVWIADDPQTAVVRGALKLLENQELLNRVKVTGGLK